MLTAGVSITDKTVDCLAEQLDGIAMQWEAHKIPAPVTFAWPCNAMTPAAIDILKQHGIPFARRGGAPEYLSESFAKFAAKPY